MSELTISIDETRLRRLRERASVLGVTTDRLVLKAIDSVLDQPDAEFFELLNEMLQEDAELFRRLA